MSEWISVKDIPNPSGEAPFLAYNKKDMHFCGLDCLDKWVKEQIKRKYVSSNSSS